MRLKRGQNELSRFSHFGPLTGAAEVSNLDPVVSVALEEVALAGYFIIALASKEVGKLGTGIEHVNTVMQAPKAKVTNLLKQATKQHVYWRKGKLKSLSATSKLLLKL